MAKWRNKIELQDLLDEDENDQAVLIICGAVIPQLEEILKKEKGYKENPQKGDPKPVDDKILEEFHNVIEEFKWIKENIEKGEDSEQFSYDDWCEALNDKLEALYDVGDSQVSYKTFFDQEKFLFVA